MREFINNLPRDQEEPSPLDVSFLFGGYSWRDKDFRFWKLRGDEQRFVAEPPHHWGPEKNRLRIQFVGDQMVVAEAKKQLAKKMRQKGKLPDGDFDMEPFEVLRDLIRSNQFPSVGGAPQLIKVYEHMNVLPFGLYWPDRKSGKVAALGRPLMDYEISSWPVLDPDDIQFKPDDAATHVQLH